MSSPGQDTHGHQGQLVTTPTKDRSTPLWTDRPLPQRRELKVEIARHYSLGATLHELAQHYRSTTTTMSRAVKAHRVKIRSQAGIVRLPCVPYRFDTGQQQHRGLTNPLWEYSPVGVDLDHPSAARICDWLHGGYENYRIDRELGTLALAAFPAWATLARLTRDFVGHAVRHCHTRGVRQFLDLGCGLVLTPNVHDLADHGNTDQRDTSSRCVYVELDPVAAAHMTIMVEERCDPTRHTVLQADLRAAHLLADVFQPNGLLDPDQPTAIIASSVLHHIQPADGAETAIARLLDSVPSGSYLIATHLTTHGVPPDVAGQLEDVRQLYAGVNPPLYYRTLTGFAAFFAGLELCEPGIPWLPRWLPDHRPVVPAAWPTDAAESGLLAAIGRTR
jgi:S-adenosyl methyltransferase